MATTATDGKVTLRGRFADGTKVRLVPRATDHPVPGATEAPGVASATTKDGETTFSGVPCGPYYAVADGYPDVMVTAKPANFENSHPDLRKRSHLAEEDRIRNVEAHTKAVKAAVKADPLANSPAPGKTMPDYNPTHGARTTTDTRHAEQIRQVEQRQAELTRPAHDKSTAQLDAEQSAEKPGLVERAKEAVTGGKYEDRSLDALRKLASKKGITGASKLNKAQVIEKLRDA